MNFFDLILKWDHDLFLAVNSWNGGGLDYIFGWPTFLGENLICLSLVGILMALWDPAHFKKRFFYYALCVLALGILVHLIKSGVGRPRPYHFFNHDFQSGLIRVNYLYKMLLSKSFPSGHAALSFMTAIILHRFYGRRVWFIYPFAVLISFTRIYVGAHFPSDVMGGAAVGVLTGLLATKILRRIDLTSPRSGLKSDLLSS